MGIHVFERGWLSSNNILMVGAGDATVVDTGYATHADLTVGLLRRALGERPLHRILNTHLHSDHCGGNAALKAAWPMARIAIPPGLATAVAQWDAISLSHEPTGQQCPRFHADAVLQPGDTLNVGGLDWQLHAAPGHDHHAVILFQAGHRILLSADALWANGFGVVFPELDGESGFTEVEDTLNLIASLAPEVVIPGHGAAFGGAAAIDEALKRARSRLEQFQKDPARHRQHALKVLIKFKLLEWQQCHRDQLWSWFGTSDYFQRIARQDFEAPMSQVLDKLVADLVRSGALAIEGGYVLNR